MRYMEESFRVEHLVSASIQMYRAGQTKLSYALAHPKFWEELTTFCANIALRNAESHEHPIDSMIFVLRHPNEQYSTNITDEALPRFINTAAILSLIQIGILMEIGNSFNEAIDLCYDNGFFAWLSSHGRHAASDDYDDLIGDLKYIGLWIE